MKLQYILDTAIGVVGALIYLAIGDITAELSTLICLMLLDIVTGFLVASVFKASRKTSSGALSSKEMLKGFVRKIGMLILIAIAFRLDMMLNVNYIKNATIIALIVEECLSLIENIGLMGIPIPKFISSSIDVLNSKVQDLIKKGDNNNAINRN